jgi:LmbE family N-acetylglucosaminyl deacetylase
MTQEHWIFLSPHFDDVALSCGGLVWDLARQGQKVEIWTLMSGYPPGKAYSEFAQQNHLRWGLSGEATVHTRQGEDQAACEVLGAQFRHFDWPDAIYRQDPSTGEPLVNNNEELFGKAPEDTLVDSIQHMLKKEIPQHARVVMPLGLGHHIDHLAVSRAGEACVGSKFYYTDYPYILKVFDVQTRYLSKLKKQPHPLNEQALIHWQEAVLRYTSQLSDFWRDEEETRLSIRNYLAGGGGRLWTP